MLSIAVVEDNDDLRSAIVSALRTEGHRVVGVDCAESFIDACGGAPIDLMVVDLNLPGEDGLDLTRRMRSVQSDIGVVMLTARNKTDDRRLGYESGADIYLTKPVALEELGAAIRALSRRLGTRRSDAAAIVVDVRGLLLRSLEAEIALSAHEAAVLAAFLRAPDRRLETWQLTEMAGHGGDQPNRNALNVMLFRLGRKLRQVGAPERPVRSIRNWGYQLCGDIALA
jgi:two-component system, OmpR family, response regulator